MKKFPSNKALLFPFTQSSLSFGSRLFKVSVEDKNNPSSLKENKQINRGCIGNIKLNHLSVEQRDYKRFISFAFKLKLKFINTK